MANKQLKTLTLPNAQGEPITYDLHPNWENIENKPNSFPSELDTTLAISGVAADAAAVGEAINSLDKTIAVDENSDGNIEIRSYLPEQDYLQLDKSLTVEGAAAEGAAVGEALAGKAPAGLADYTPYNGRKNMVTNLLHIDLTNPDAFCNKASVVATEDASTLIDSPITSGAFYAYREVMFINSPVGQLPKCVVRLTQTYPFECVIWLNIYDDNVGRWSGWKKFEDSTRFASAGYGLGDKCVPVDSMDDALRAGFYRASGVPVADNRTLNLWGLTVPYNMDYNIQLVP